MGVWFTLKMSQVDLIGQWFLPAESVRNTAMAMPKNNFFIFMSDKVSRMKIKNTKFQSTDTNTMQETLQP